MFLGIATTSLVRKSSKGVKSSGIKKAMTFVEVQPEKYVIMLRENQGHGASSQTSDRQRINI